MDLDLSDDQVALRDGIAALLAGRFAIDRVRAGFDRAMFDELADAGVFSLRADGFAWADAAVVFEQLGRRCVPGPLVASLLARRRPDRRRRRPTSRAGVGRAPRRARRAARARRRTAIATRRPGGARRPSRRRGRSTRSRRSRASTRCPPATAIDVDGAELAARRARCSPPRSSSASPTGCTELAVAYAKERVQFDRPIGSFQAIKHLCADMLDAHRGRARRGVRGGRAPRRRRDLDGLDRASRGAKLLAGEAAIANGKTATQVHGGMGFTWEVDVHLYLKRAWVLDTHFGSADDHADRRDRRRKSAHRSDAVRELRRGPRRRARSSRPASGAPTRTARTRRRSSGRVLGRAQLDAGVRSSKPWPRSSRIHRLGGRTQSIVPSPKSMQPSSS